MSAVFVRSSFKERVEQWAREDQIYVYALQLSIERLEWDALISDPICVIESVTTDAQGEIKQVAFWMKIRMDYVHLTLELRMPGVFVLNG